MHRSVCTVILRMVCRLSSGQRATRRYRMLFFFSSTNGLAVSFVWQRERQEKPRGEGGVQEKLFIIINILMKMSSILGGGASGGQWTHETVQFQTVRWNSPIFLYHPSYYTLIARSFARSSVVDAPSTPYFTPYRSHFFTPTRFCVPVKVGKHEKDAPLRGEKILSSFSCVLAGRFHKRVVIFWWWAENWLLRFLFARWRELSDEPCDRGRTLVSVWGMRSDICFNINVCVSGWQCGEEKMAGHKQGTPWRGPELWSRAPKPIAVHIAKGNWTKWRSERVSTWFRFCRRFIIAGTPSSHHSLCVCCVCVQFWEIVPHTGNRSRPAGLLRYGLDSILDGAL